ANLPALDEALIKTIQFWKGYLSTELGSLSSNLELSALFNAIIFTRAVEDHYRAMYYKQRKEWLAGKTLYQTCLTNGTQKLSLREVIVKTLEKFGHTDVPASLIDQDLLSKFDLLTAETVRALIEDFYRIKG